MYDPASILAQTDRPEINAARRAVIEANQRLDGLEKALELEREERRNSENRSERRANIALFISVATFALQTIALILGRS